MLIFEDVCDEASQGISWRESLSSRAFLRVVHSNSVASFCSSTKPLYFSNDIVCEVLYLEPSQHEAAGEGVRISPLISNTDQLWWMPLGSGFSPGLAQYHLTDYLLLNHSNLQQDIHLLGHSWHCCVHQTPVNIATSPKLWKREIPESSVINAKWLH